MKRGMKRAIKSASFAALVIAILMSFACIAGASDVKEKIKQDGITWTLYSSGTLTVSGEGSAGKMPDALYKTYTGKNKKGTKIKKVKVNKGITRIEHSTFKYGADVTEVTVADSVKVIKGDAFAHCEKLKSAKLPKYMKAVTNYVFAGCVSLEKVTLPQKLEIIRNGAFENCESLKKIELPKTLKKIKAYAFDGCYNLEAPVLPDGLEYLSGFSRCYFADGFEIPDSVKTIGYIAFENTYIREIKIPNGVEVIENAAFKNCNGLEKVTLPSSLTNLGHEVFYKCRSLKKISIPSSLKKISFSAFYGCEKLESVKIASGVEEIDSSAFSHCTSLKKVDIPASVKSIGEYAFRQNETEYIIVRNPECELSNDCVGVKYDDWALEHYEEIDEEDYRSLADTVIIGYKGSTAESYAKDTGLKFVPLDKNSTEHYFTKSEPVKKATLKKDGKVKLTCPCGYSEQSPVAKIAKISLSKTKFVYSGKAQKPAVTVKDANGKKLTEGVDYTVKYSKGCKKVGQYTATVTLKGNYSGTKKLTFTIVPKGTSVTKVTAEKKQFTVKWKKQTTETTGYQVQYSTSKTMKNAKKGTVKGNSSTSLAVNNLKSGKTYFVRVRAYKTVTVGSEQVKLYSGWSEVKSVRVK